MFLVSLPLSAIQSQSEFELHPNGLIYSESTIGKLSRIVDSLNLKFRRCELNKVYYAKSQGLAHIVRLDTGNIAQAAEDLRRNLSFDAFVNKYPHAELTLNALVVKYRYKNYHDQRVVEYSEIDPASDYGSEITRPESALPYEKEFGGSWLFDYHQKSEYSREYITAFYFPKNLQTAPLKHVYCQQIAYADCLIDTTAEKFLKNAKTGDPELPENWQSSSLKKKQKLLQKMRSTRVVGFCSMDSRPREHAINIALLSAETTNWEVFLRSHLDIMNDRFDRMSDGSYAWAQRQTYIRELEELNINLKDLLLGITLRIENPASNHYYGSIGRIGRAIAEANERGEFEKQILAMIEDNELDDYNRLIAYFLFNNYSYYLTDKAEQKNRQEKLKVSVTKLPDYLTEKIRFAE